MLQFRGSVVTSDAGLLAYRELDDALGLSTMAGETLADARTGKNERHALVGLLPRLNLNPLTWTSPCEDWSLTSLKEKPQSKIGAKSRQPRPRYIGLPDGRGRHPTAKCSRRFCA